MKYWHKGTLMFMARYQTQMNWGNDKKADVLLIFVYAQRCHIAQDSYACPQSFSNNVCDTMHPCNMPMPMFYAPHSPSVLTLLPLLVSSA